MKLINAALQEKQLKLKELSEQLRQDIKNHQEMVVKYNMACEQYESEEEEDVETEKKLDEQEDFIAANEAEIAKHVREFEKPVVQEAVSDAPASPPAPVKKESSSAGWLIFGGAVLLVTLGAVNVFKRKA
jgi:translation elongation factor EF-1alpha